MSTDISSSSWVVVAVSSDAFSFLVCVLLFFVYDDLSFSSSFFFLRTGDFCVCVLGGLRLGMGILRMSQSFGCLEYPSCVCCQLFLTILGIVNRKRGTALQSAT